MLKYLPKNMLHTNKLVMLNSVSAEEGSYYFSNTCRKANVRKRGSHEKWLPIRLHDSYNSSRRR